MAGDRMMRYIVPFYFDGAYEEVCRKLSEASDEWEPGQVACRYVYRHIYQTVNYAKGEKENRVESGDRTDNQLKLIYGSN